MCEALVRAAEETIVEAKRKLSNALRKSKLCRNKFQTAQSMIEMGIKRKVDVTEELSMLHKKNRNYCIIKIGK